MTATRLGDRTLLVLASRFCDSVLVGQSGIVIKLCVSQESSLCLGRLGPSSLGYSLSLAFVKLFLELFDGFSVYGVSQATLLPMPRSPLG